MSDPAKNDAAIEGGQFPRIRRIAMKRINLTEAKARLSHLFDQAVRDRGVIIAKSGIPKAKLVLLDDEKPQEFKFGTLRDVLTDENR